MIHMYAYVVMGRLVVVASFVGPKTDQGSRVTPLGGGEVSLDPLANYEDEDLLHLMCEVGMDISSDSWATRELF